MLPPWFARSQRYAWRLLAVLCLLLALLATASRLASPYLQTHKGALLAWLLAEQPLQAEVGEIQLSWRGMGPALALRELTLLAPAATKDPLAAPLRPQVRVKRVWLQLDLWQSLRQRQAVLGNVTLRDGQVQLATLTTAPARSTAAPTTAAPLWPMLIALFPRVSLENIHLALINADGAWPVLVLKRLHLRQYGARYLGEGYAAWAAAEQPSAGHIEGIPPSEMTDNEPSARTAVAASLRRGGARMQQALQQVLNPAPDARGRLRVQLDLHAATGLGAPVWEQARGQIYLAAEALDITPLVHFWPGAAAAKTPRWQGQLNGQLWLEVRAGQWHSALLALGDNVLSQAALGQLPARRYALSGGHIQWQRQGENWQLASHGVMLEAPSDPAAAPSSSSSLQTIPLTLQIDRRGEEVDGHLPAIDLAALQPLLQLVASRWPQMGTLLARTAPHGQVRDVQVTHTAQQGWALSGRLQDVGLNAWQQVPGVARLNGNFWVSRQSAHMALQVHDEWLLPCVHFKAPLALERLALTLDAWREPAGWVLYGQQVALENADLTLNGQFRLELFAQPFLALASQFKLKQAAHAQRYFPKLAMSRGLIDYLSAAIGQGESDTGALLWHGALGDFPYHDGSGIFQVFLPLRDARFTFFPGWPALSALALGLGFENDRMTLHSQGAQLGEASAAGVVQLSDLVGEIAPLGAAPLHIAAKIAGPAPAISHYLANSPLRGSVGATLQEVVIGGDIQGTVDLTIPFSGAAVHASGVVDFKRNDVWLKRLGVPLSAVSGQLWYSHEATGFDDLQATLWQQPLTLSYRGQPSPAGYQVELGLKGQARSGQLPAVVEQLGILAGQTPWAGQVSLTLPSAAPFYFDAQLTSDLRGLALDLPAPLAKAAATAWPLRLGVRGRDGALSVQGQMGDARLRSRLSYARGDLSLTEAHLAIGEAPARMLASPATAAPPPLWLTIHQPSADVLGWIDRLQDWQASYRAAAPSIPLFAATERAVRLPAAVLPTGRAWLPAAWRVEGQLAEARFGQAALHDAEFSLQPDARGTLIAVQSRELAGEVRVPSAPRQPLAVTLARLHWGAAGDPTALPALISAPAPAPADAVTSAPTVAVVAAAEQSAPRDAGLASATERAAAEVLDRALLRRLPWMTLRCDACQLGAGPTWHGQAELLPGANRLTLRGIELTQGQSQLTGQLDWTLAGEAWQSQLRGQLVSPSSEALIRAWAGVSPITDAPATLRFDLNWPQSPHRLALATLNGVLDAKLAGGTLHEVSDKGARMLSVLSFDSLLRKLRLDFRDVFDKGLYFESMQASAKISQGQLSNDDFYMKGAAGNLRGQGGIDLGAGELDYDLSFSPNLAGNLPVVAAFSLTPVTGLYVMALSKLLAPAVDVITRLNFRLHGPLRAPRLTDAGRAKGQLRLDAEQQAAMSELLVPPRP
ncbi:MAG: YhdP family protein [Aeromonas sp.]